LASRHVKLKACPFHIEYNKCVRFFLKTKTNHKTCIWFQFEPLNFILCPLKMTENKLNSQRQTLMHFWNNGVRSQTKLHKITGIPLSTIKYNIQKLKKNW
jgi:hypothetical protein